ncbi:MAG: hypothetical protein QOG04_2210 [Actinomycetota bacterium]|jgi:hypothetical protein|nr:hypothetical protein [Actinomycetota bacterium]
MKRAGLLAAILVGLFMMPLILVTALLSLASDQPSPSARAREEIPPELIPLYQAAAQTCEGLEWTVLAAIHKVETGFGKSRATSSKGAQGPMQFMPSTFASYRVDGDGDGEVDIDNVSDAVFSAAHMLCANGAADPAHLATAVWNYNHSQSYVNEVLTLASHYGVVLPPEGVAFAQAVDLLDNRRVILTPQARADLSAGIVDQRVISLLSWISERHTIGVTVFATGHSRYTRSGSVSNHYFGRAADVFFVDGSPVGGSNIAARDVISEIAKLEGSLRPTELGHPFGAIGFPGGFTDQDHADHIHIGFDS